MRNRLLFFLTVMFISSSLLISLSQQFVEYSRNEIKKIDPELMRIKSLRYQEKVKVIVWLNENKSKESLNKIGRVDYDYSIIHAVAMEVSVNDLENLAKESSVEKIVPDRLVSAFRLESMEVIKASNASSTFSVNGTGVNISVIDTGIFNHTEFQSSNRIIKQKCYCNVTLNCCPDGTAESDNATDDEGHGTHCAGIAAGKGDGYTHGVATNASLFAVKVLNSAGGGRESDLIAGIEWSIQNGAKVISLSLGGNLGSYQCYDFSSSEVVDNATKQGVVMIVAAGNCGPGGSPIQCPVLGNQTIAAPACAKRVITVGNTDDNDNIASSSSRGSTKDNMTKPDLTAPGNSINSTYKDGGYYTDGGTSMSTPHVAGVAALLIQRYNQINSYYPNPDRVKAILITAVNTTGMNAAGYQQRNNFYGSGRIDAYEALRIINFTKNNTISTGQEHHYKINVTSTDFKTTLYWPEDKDTNNNLNLIVGNSTHNISYPTDPNDTVEQVFVDNANDEYWDVYIDCVSGSNQTYYLASNMEISDDVTPPVLILIKPENITYNNRTWVPLNFTTDMTNHTVWYTIDGENRTVITRNTTFNVTSDGQHNITLYVNDSYNNINQSTRYFSVDAVTPIINIVSPVSNLTMNYTTKSIWFNISLNENGNVSLCSVDGGGNFTLNSLNQTYFYNLSIISEGYHNVTFYVNDSVNWVNSSSINFTVMIKPNMTNSNVDKRLVLFNENVNITANIYDDNLNSTWINITWPNGLSILRNMSNSSSSYYYLFNDTNQTGNYNVTIFANDTIGNFNNVSVNFTVSDSVNVSSTVTNGSVSVNVSVKIFYNGTSQIRNQTTNTIFDFIIPSGLWDLGINTTQLNVTLFNVNLTQNFTRDIKFSDDVQMGNLSSNVNTLKTVAVKFDNFTFSSANLTFLFNPNLVNNYSNLNVYKCHNWSFTNSNCSSNWQKDSDDTTFNAIINNNNVTLFTLNFSAFSLSENQTTTTTTTTTIAATTTTVSSGDGGDGGSNPTTTTTTSTISTTSTIETTVSSQQQPSGTTTTTVVEEEKIATHEIKAWYIIPVLIVAVSIVVFWYVKYYKESGEDIVFKTLKEKWGQHIFVVNFSLT